MPMPEAVRLGLEALSRGAKHVILIENAAEALGVIRENAELLAVKDRVTVLRGRAAALIPKHECDVAFVDPPYQKEQEYEDSMTALAATACGLAIAQHQSRLILPEQYAALAKVRTLKQGDNTLSFFERTT